MNGPSGTNAQHGDRNKGGVKKPSEILHSRGTAGPFFFFFFKSRIEAFLNPSLRDTAF